MNQHHDIRCMDIYTCTYLYTVFFTPLHLPHCIISAGNAIQAFGNGTDVGVWQPQPPIQPTALEPGITRRAKDRNSNTLDALTDMTKLDLDGNSLYHICGTLQVKL